MAEKRFYWIGQAIEQWRIMTKGQRARQAYSMARFGKTYQYIAAILGVSRQRVHQMIVAQSVKFGELPKRTTGNKKGWNDDTTKQRLALPSKRQPLLENRQDI